MCRITIAQNLAFVGLSYSSPIVACGMANQSPAFSFILGILLRYNLLIVCERAKNVYTLMPKYYRVYCYNNRYYFNELLIILNSNSSDFVLISH